MDYYSPKYYRMLWDAIPQIVKDTATWTLRATAKLFLNSYFDKNGNLLQKR